MSNRMNWIYKLPSLVYSVFGIGVTPLDEIQDWEPDASESLTEFDSQAAYEEDYQASMDEAAQWAIEHEKLKARSKYLPADTIGSILKRPKSPITAYIKDFLYAGAITIFAGEPKAGKTTFSLHALGALTRGDEFLGEKLSPTVTLYATEQTEVSFASQAEKVPSLHENEKFRVILFEDNTVEKDRPVQKESGKIEYRPTAVFPSTWEEQIDLWSKAIIKNKAKVFVMDTLTAFSNFHSGEAFDPGVVQSRLQALKVLISRIPDLAILILHHMRKESNGQGQSKPERTFSDIANSYALRAGSDMNILFFQPSTNEEDKMIRSVVIEGRFINQQHSYQLELTPKGFEKEQEPYQHEANKPDEQTRILELVRQDPSLNDLPVRAFMDRTGAKINQAQKFRATFPKGTPLVRPEQRST